MKAVFSSLLFLLTTTSYAVSIDPSPIGARVLGAHPVEMEDVTFKLPSGKVYSGSRILPNGPHPLNQLAKKVDRELDRLPIIYSEELLGGAGANGAYSPSGHMLFVPQSALAAETLGPVVLHELVHATLWAALRHGTPVALNGRAYNDQPDFQQRPYGPAFALDEVAATFYSMRHHARSLRAELESALNSTSLSAFAGPMDAISEVRVFASRLTTMLSTLRLGIEKGTPKGPLPTPEDLAFVIGTTQWQELATSDVRIVLPAQTSAATLASVLEFAKEAIVAFEKADDVGAKLQAMSGASKQQRYSHAKQFLDLIETVVSSFHAKFLKETLIMDRIEEGAD